MHDLILLISNRTPLEAGLREALEDTDLELRIGHDGASGLQLAWDTLPGVIVIDADHRNPSGFTISNVLRENPRMREIPLVLVSETKDQADLDQHGQSRYRADAYVPAPGAPADVAARAQELLTEERDARVGRLKRIPAEPPNLPNLGLTYLLVLIAAAVLAVIIYLAWMFVR